MATARLIAFADTKRGSRRARIPHVAPPLILRNVDGSFNPSAIMRRAIHLARMMGHHGVGPAFSLAAEDVGLPPHRVAAGRDVARRSLRPVRVREATVRKISKERRLLPARVRVGSASPR